MIACQPDVELPCAQVLACMALSKSGRYLATGQQSTVGLAADVSVWDLASSTLVHRCSLHKVRASRSCCSPWQLLKTCSTNGPDVVGRPVQAKVQAVDFSPCEQTLASVGALSPCAVSLP